MVNEARSSATRLLLWASSSNTLWTFSVSIRPAPTKRDRCQHTHELGVTERLIVQIERQVAGPSV